MSTLSIFFSELIKSIFSVSFNLFKLMIPIIITVKIIEELDGIKYIAIGLEPLMQLVGLPASMGLVWATTMLTGIYGGMIIFVGLAGQESLTVAQVTVLGGMMLVAHALPIELRIIQKAGVRVLYVFLLRVLGALLLGFLLHQLYSMGDYLNQPNQALWNPVLNTDKSIIAWILNQLKTFFQIFIIIALLMTLLKIFKVSGIENLIASALQPLLRLIGLSKNTTSVSIIGVLLGIIYGGGLLINEAKSGKVDKKEIFCSITLLALLHSVIEDTILIMLMGAHISGALFFRILFALVLTSIIIRILKSISMTNLQRFLVYPDK
jgi:hypothetical protein